MLILGLYSKNHYFRMMVFIGEMPNLPNCLGRLTENLSVSRFSGVMPHVTCFRIVSINKKRRKEIMEFNSNLNAPERNRFWGLLCLLALTFSVMKTVVNDRVIENLMEKKN